MGTERKSQPHLERSPRREHSAFLRADHLQSTAVRAQYPPPPPRARARVCLQVFGRVPQTRKEGG